MTPHVIPLLPVADDVDRRTFVKLLGATLLAGSGMACAEPNGEIVPYVHQPPELVPGVPLHFATTMELDGFGTGLVAESRNGRPVKIEGNPAHPASLGAAGVFEQASVLQLYDPDRGRYITHRGATAAWGDLAAALAEGAIRERAGSRGTGLRLLLEPTASPTHAAAIARVRERYPDAGVYHYAPLNSQNATIGAGRVLQRRLQPIYDFAAADVVVCIDADPAGAGPFHLRYARQLADRRRVRHPGDSMSRIYAAEGRYTPTGIIADHRLSLRPSAGTALLAELLRTVAAGSGNGPATLQPPTGLPAEASGWAGAVARDLLAHRGRALVVVGDGQSVEAHALGIALNDLLGAGGSAVTYVESPLATGDGEPSALAEAIRAGEVTVLLALGGNPAYDMPAGLDFGGLLESLPVSVYAGLYANETARLAGWYVPSTHYLETWGDARALDGTAAIVQPLIAPLHGGHSLLEILSLLAGDGRPPQDLVRDYWRSADRPGGGPEAWREALRQGVIVGTANPAVAAEVAWDRIGGLAAAAPAAEAIEVAFVADPRVHDGRFANNGWLQELPDPVSKVTWDNAAFMSAATAARVGVEPSQAVAVEVGGRRLDAPVFVEPGVADGLIVLPFGYGRRGAETVAAGVGVNAFALWAGRSVETDVRVSRASAFGLPLVHEFAVTAAHWTLEGRSILPSATLDEFRAHPDFTADQRGPVSRLYGDAPRTAGPQWAMAIDLTVCTGCSACMVACQAENNVPVVGKAGVQQGREMHWLRIDRYLTDAGRLDVQPMLCQQCEAAPCEYVCPVNATVHSPDGLNEMVYNRCVGTRFCSNNCPYKVRRFNFYNYTSEMSETEKMAMNPDVTVRARGVMEKCTFCVQRIRRAQIDCTLEGSDAPLDGLQTACQQACPTRAIVFGSIADPDSAVARDGRADQRYHVLHELGTRPRISYLARLRNAGAAVPERTP